MIRYRDKKGMALLTITVLCLMASGTAIAQKGEKEQDRVKDAGYVMKELLTARPGIPAGVLNKAECVIVIPSMRKAGFILAGSYVRGIMTCRTGEEFSVPWSTPTM